MMNRRRVTHSLCLGVVFASLSSLTGCAPGPGPTNDAANDSASDALDGSVDGAVTDDVVDVADTPDVPPVPVQVTTQAGPIVGRRVNMVDTFLGIPYAAPPVGNLRWKPPIAHAPWTSPLDVATVGNPCPQRADMLSATPASSNEDCLTLNVFTTAIQSSQRRPVMVFIHGGGFTSGYGGSALYDGKRLAQGGNVVVVTINYRLGQFGYLALEGLRDEDPVHRSAGNYGFLDQQFALRWVQDNIAAFGGDANNVTLFGESAGSMSVCAQMTSPLAQGLFHKTIQQSGSCRLLFTPLERTGPNSLESALELGNRFATTLGCTTGDNAARVACLRAKSTAEVLATNATPFELTTRARFQPNIDGYVLPALPWTQVRNGTLSQRVTTLQGVNRDEGTAFGLIAPVTTLEDLRTRIEGMVPGRTDEVIALYSITATNVSAKWAEFLGDFLFNCQAHAQAKYFAQNNIPTRLYQFVKEGNVGRALRLGVFHAAELPYVFGNFTTPFILQPTDRAVSDVTLAMWAQFATTGDPNVPAMSPTWPVYDPTADTHYVIGDTLSTATALRQAQCAVLDAWPLFE